MREYFDVLFRRPPSHEEIMEWLQKYSKAHHCGSHYLFRRDGIILMAQYEDQIVHPDAESVEPSPLPTVGAANSS